ncbi:MAG TPA: glycosyltransferase [Actinomycetota bacterium]
MSPGTTGARIALVTGQTEGGIGRHVVSLVPELVNRGASVEVLGPTAMRSMGAEATGAAFCPVEIPGGGAPSLTGRAFVRLVRRLRGADLVHAHGIRAGLIGGLAARLAGTRHVIVTVHNAVEGRPGAAGAAERLLAVLAERRLYVSGDIADRARAAVAARAGSVVVMPVGAEIPSEELGPTAAVEARASLGLPEGARLVVSVGRLARQKGFDVLVDAAALLDGDSVMVAVAGQGPERPMLEDRIRERGASGRVLLLGFRPDARALVAAADVVCMPSRWEGSPLALHEAMSAGRPVVATAVGGIPALAGDAAVLVPPDDPPALAAALRRVLGDSDLRARMGEASRAAAAAWPDAAATARRVVDLYEEVLGCPLSGASQPPRRARNPLVRARRPPEPQDGDHPVPERRRRP